MTNYDNDHMDLGDSNLVPIKDGWYINKVTKERIDPNGFVFDEDGNLVYDPFERKLSLNYNREEYDFFDD
jgi:hypothetical protein